MIYFSSGKLKKEACFVFQLLKLGKIRGNFLRKQDSLFGVLIP
jgi:hypothetical protein